jgi:hypothetical protein
MTRWEAKVCLTCLQGQQPILPGSQKVLQKPVGADDDLVVIKPPDRFRPLGTHVTHFKRRIEADLSLDTEIPGLDIVDDQIGIHTEGHRNRPPPKIRPVLSLKAQALLGAKATGGTSFDTARNLTDLDAAFAKIAEEMRSLYSIANVSSNSKKDGSLREIKVTVDRSEGRVRARRGYYSRH